MPEEHEWKTRKERIDKKLRSLSIPWNIVKYNDRLDTSTLQRHANILQPAAAPIMLFL